MEYNSSIILRKRKKSFTDVFIYISVVFMVMPDLNLGVPSFFSHVSLYSSLIYILLNLKTKIGNLKKSELAFAAVIVLAFLEGLLMNGIRGVSLAGWFRTLYGFIGFFLIYISYRIFFMKKGYLIDRFWKTVFYSYTFILLAVGFIQLSYIHLGLFGFLNSSSRFILKRGSGYFIGLGGGGRPPFLFGEPSFCGTFFYTWFFPAFLWCKKKNVVTEKKANAIFGLMLFVNILAFSSRFVVDTIVVLLVLLLSRIKSYKVKKKTFQKILLVLIGLAIVFVAFFNQITNLTVFKRIGYVLSSFQSGIGSGRDNSFIARFQYLRCGILGFLSMPLTGYGLGNYIEAFRKFVIIPNNVYAASEIRAVLNLDETSSFSFYTTFLCECGILGLFLIIIVLQNLLKIRKDTLRLVSWIIIFFLIQTELYGFLTCAAWLAFINSDLYKSFNGYYKQYCIR